MGETRLSVIVPGYDNRPEWWRRCIDSVRAACGPDDEIICVDDGSREPVRPEWVSAGIDPRVRLLRKENGGLASARNFGMEAMRGRYVTFVDSDDVVREGAYAKCMESLESSGADIAFYGVEVVWVAERLCRVDSLPGKFYGNPSADDVLAIKKARLFNYACNKVYKVELLRRGNVAFKVDGMPCEDVIFNLECAAAGMTWVGVDYAGYVYYHRTSGTLVSAYKKSNMSGLLAERDAWQRFAATLSEGERGKLKAYCEPPERAILLDEWNNIWRPGTPFSLRGRWRWLKEHGEVGGIAMFLKTAAFQFVRRHFYFAPLRRFHIRRLYPNVRGADLV